MALKSRNLFRRPSRRVAVQTLGASLGFGLLLGQGWLIDKLLSQNGRLLLRLERLEAMQGCTARVGAAGAHGSPARVDASPLATFSRAIVTERRRWDDALEEFGGTAMQSWRWGEFLQRIGFTVARVRVDGLLGTGMAQVVFLDLGHGTTAHIPRGPVIVGDWLPVARELFAAIDELAVRHHAVSLTIEPDAPLSGDAAFEALGFVAADQPHYSPAATVRVPLSDDQGLLDQMRQGTRYKVRQGQRCGVRVTKYSSSDADAMDAFYDLLQDTAQRNNFEIQGRDYYADFMTVFREDAALMLAHLGDIPVGGLIVARAVDEAIYMFGASSTEHRVLGATACLQFEAMRWARDHGCTRYDLWGISDNSTHEESLSKGHQQQSQNGKYEGYSQFKVGFGGDIVTYPPAWKRRVRNITNDTSATDGERYALTIGMATYNDFDGVYFTIQALRLYQDLNDTELLVIDNFGCQRTKEFLEQWANCRYVLATEAVGTAAPRDLVFREARGEAVLCCDSHVLFAPGSIARLRAYYREHPSSVDLLQGPLMFDDLQNIATHFDPIWSDQMWGMWATDARGEDPEGEPFDIPMQGLGVFSCRKSAWPGFNPRFRGFGGEEGYIHEKVRQAGGRCLCLPWLRWVHRFGRTAGEPYPVTVEDKFRNYLIGHAELGLHLEPIVAHFGEHLPEATMQTVAAEALGKGATQMLERLLAVK